MNIDPSIYIAHAAFWTAFVGTRWAVKVTDGRAEPASAGTTPVSSEAKTASYSRVLVTLHMVAFGIMYWGIWRAVILWQMPVWFPGQRGVGCAVIAVGAALVVWSLLYFRSWRIRAQLERGHELATGGPFALLRNPIYMGFNLLALGSALWIPALPLWIGFGLMIVGSDLRARAEETILDQAFGATYRQYRARTRRFLPGIY